MSAAVGRGHLDVDAARRPGVAGDVREALGDDEVGGGLDRAGKRSSGTPRIEAGTVLRLARPAQGRVEAALGQHRRVDAAGELAQLGRRLAQVGASPRRAARGPRPGRSSTSRRRGHAQRHRDADELLLGAVVEVALDPPPRLVGGLDDARARLPQLALGPAAVGDVAQVAGEDRRRRGRRSG